MPVCYHHGVIARLQHPAEPVRAQITSRIVRPALLCPERSILSDWLARRDEMGTTAQPGVVFPPRDLTALLDLGRFLEHHTEPGLLLGPDGEQVPLPEEVYRVLVEVVQAMREGKVITLVPRTQRLTTQE